MGERSAKSPVRKVVDKLLLLGVAVALVAPFAWLYASHREAPLICRSADDLDLLPADEDLVVAAGLHDADMAALDRFENLKELQIQYGEFTDAAMPHISRHAGLTRLIIESDPISDAGVAELEKLPELTELMLLGCREVTTRGLGFLPRLGKLQTLVLYRMSALDGTVGATLAQCRTLERLEFQSLRGLTDEVVVQVANLPALKHLALELCPLLTEACIEPILGMQQLESLSLLGVDSLTDVGMLRLAALKNLKSLVLPARAGLSKAAIDQLEKALPRCEIKL